MAIFARMSPDLRRLRSPSSGRHFWRSRLKFWEMSNL
ncbi:cyclic nucleotide gated channel 1 [Prunus dulcis]|uniref:Cyclic nucleotide gated channel 1 n=1 Tax=Prunus dulcis TaxID=3755 RepID=A0A4Y1R3B9_PRUDU|nr:cyclic nucleotide gated channel 1 [Prunus dulcis]